MIDRVIISGPPGVGKTVVGRRLAQRLGTSAIDLDEAIERRQQRSCAAIIKTDGEAEFRAIEARTLEELEPEHGIVSLGGGTLTTARGRAAARRRGRVLGLQADPGTLRARIDRSGAERPLLETRRESKPRPSGAGDVAQDLEALLDARKTSYAAVDRRVDAAADLETVVDRVAGDARSIELIFAEAGSTSTRVVVGEGLEDALAGAVAAIAPTRPVLAIADRGIPAEARARYLARVSALFPTHAIEVPGGEAVKSWTFLGQVLEEALAHGCGRQSAVIGLGGGATLDLAALAANLLGRGAPLVLAPSTLLAQVDASIGGKTAVNTASGRNLIGTFYPANDVIVDLALLASLSVEERRSGIAELLKIALVRDPVMFHRIGAGGPKAVNAEEIARAIRHKAAIVARDPSERGERKLLNLGHTLGHALETASGFTLRHGDAVAIGIAAIARYSMHRRWLGAGECAQIVEALQQAGLPVDAEAELLSRSVPFLAADKKGDARGVDLVCVREVGKVFVERVSSSEVVELVRFGGKA